MSNEVYIDGVNVAECEFLGKYNVCKAYVYMPKPCGCDYNPDCYFKQLQRAKAENEKLKAEVKEIRTWEELKLSKYRKALEEVREWLLKWRFNANIIKHTNEPLNKINEVLD